MLILGIWCKMLKIIKDPNPILRKKSKAIRKITPEISKLINEMFEAMYANNGVGLAAPQIGKNIQLAVVDIGDKNQIILINPKIKKRSGKQIFQEGCLSVPGFDGPVERASHIFVKCLNSKGDPIEIEVQGFLATVIQHEMDHLTGKLFVDRVKDPELIRHIDLTAEPKEERI